MFLVIGLHALLTLATALLTPRLGPRAFLLAGAGPLSGVLLLALTARGVWAGRPWTQTVPWVPGLDLDLVLRLDGLSWLMLVLVCGVGTLVFGFCAWYAHRDPALTRFVATLTAFAGSMTGLVLADDVLLLYVFWELTSITSYLLVGLRVDEATSRRAALQALLTTTLGGLSMLAGLLMLAGAAGTSAISLIVADPPRGGVVDVAVALVLIGALTKSAQFPFHGWLPAAMAAPTPVSAYLHAAAMVKAGVYLIARLAPGFADLPWWRPTLVVLGAATLLVGGYQALRQHDLKRLLAFSTVSQLGLLVVAAGWGAPHAALALGVLLLGHGFAKAGLFLALGAVDHQTGSRDLRELDGVGSRMPLLAVATAVAAASMAGLPPFLGFIAKEELLTSLYEDPGRVALLTAVAVAAGSVLTVGYAFRFWWGAFGPRPPACAADPDAPGPQHRRLGPDATRPGPGLVLPVTVLAGLSLVLGVAPWLLDGGLAATLAPYPQAGATHLQVWHGFTPALWASVLITVTGLVLIANRAAVARVQARVGDRWPTRLSVDAGYQGLIRGTDRLAAVVTGSTQTGSLPFYLGTIVVVAVLLPGTALLLLPTRFHGAPLLDSWAQLPVAVFITGIALTLCRVRTRLTAVILLGTVGYAMALVFVLQGAPDLALTQFLVECLSIVVFLLVMRLLPAHFPRQRHRRRAALRVLTATGVGVLMTLLTLAAGSSRQRDPVSTTMAEQALPAAHGHNIVNVIIVDFRGLDTLGEGTVVVVAALALISLVLTADRPVPGPGRVVRPSLMFTMCVRAAFPATIAAALFFVFAGHNRPGGGFIGGLLMGGGFVLLYLADLPRPLPRFFTPVRFLTTGLLLATVTATVPLLSGGDVLRSGYLTVTVPVLGEVGVPSVLAFDGGIFFIVVGFTLTVLDTLGSRKETSLGQAREEVRL